MKRLNLAEWAIRHRQIIYFFIISIIIGGVFSYFRLGRSEDPNFTIREMVVAAAWPGATAEQITDQVTYPLERKLQEAEQKQKQAEEELLKIKAVQTASAASAHGNGQNFFPGNNGHR